MIVSRLDNRGLILERGRNFSPRHSVQTGAAALSVSYPISTGSYFLGDKEDRA
jgi:hypothetical protein